MSLWFFLQHLKETTHLDKENLSWEPQYKPLLQPIIPLPNWKFRDDGMADDDIKKFVREWKYNNAVAMSW